MLDLKLRPEFLGKVLKGTAIELSNSGKTGATQKAPDEFLKITYPTIDLLKAMEAIGRNEGQPIVLKGERGQGKSHLMAVLHHTLTAPDTAEAWLKDWALRTGKPKIGEIPVKRGMAVISESLSQQNFKYLWDLIFSRHPHGEYVKGAWELRGKEKTEVPGSDLLDLLIEHTPFAFILDEFQTWYDGLTNTKQYPFQKWAFNFIQLLSELAAKRPDRFILVVSVRNGDTEAYQQIHRNQPVTIDFMPTNQGRDRLRLLLHRLFENRSNIPHEEIRRVVKPRAAEAIRLLDRPPSEYDSLENEMAEAWPFSNDLIRLLEDEVLKATSAQETRDLIRILAGLFKLGGDVPVLTPADIRIDHTDSAVVMLIDSVSNDLYERLREKARRNLEAVISAQKSPKEDTPHAAELISSLWIRSLSTKNTGASPAQLQLDLTRDHRLDDNFFAVELQRIVENSFNIHQERERLFFREDENPQARLTANAKNDRLFVDGQDKKTLARLLRAFIEGLSRVSLPWRVTILPEAWAQNPWNGLDELDRPENWNECIPLLVLPESLPQAKLEMALGVWLKEKLQRRRNGIRFLVPKEGLENIYRDRSLILLARQFHLAEEWEKSEPHYSRLKKKCSDDLKNSLKGRFERFAILHRWDFQNPTHAKFSFELHNAEGEKIPEAVDRSVRQNLFIPENFDALVEQASHEDKTLGRLLEELQEPRPAGEDCIPWIGEQEIKDKLLDLCARGKVAINLQGQGHLQAKPGEDKDTALRSMRQRLPSGRQLQQAVLCRPQALSSPGSAAPAPVLSGPGPGGPSLPFGTTNTPSIPVPPPNVPVQVRLSASQSSALNLLGKLETWGIVRQTPVQSVSLRIGKLTGAMLTEMIRNLPDGVTFDLEIEKES
jgi:hypothetical protein